MIDENLWNEYRKLSPQRAKYSSDAITFKKSPKNIAQIEQNGKDDDFRADLKNLLR